LKRNFAATATSNSSGEQTSTSIRNEAEIATDSSRLLSDVAATEDQESSPYGDGCDSPCNSRDRRRPRPATVVDEKCTTTSSALSSSLAATPGRDQLSLAAAEAAYPETYENVSSAGGTRTDDPATPAMATLKDEAEGTSLEFSSYSATTVGSVIGSWLGQFNCHRVASVLVSKDPKLDDRLAAMAGERVQSQVLSRIARRRVRTFLKERDRKWGLASIEQTAAIQQEEQRFVSLSTTKESNSLFPCGIGNVVDLLSSYGLTVKDAAEILIHTPGVALMRPRSPAESGDGKDYDSKGESLEDTMDRAFVRVLCGTLRLRKYDARKVLRNCPGLLTMRGSRSAEQVVNIMSSLGISTNSIARDKNVLPTLLSRSPAGIFRLVAFLSSDAVRMPVSKIGPLLRRPVCHELLDAVVPVPCFEMNDDDEADAGAGGLFLDEMSDPGVLTALWGRNSRLRRDRINELYQKMSTTAWTLRHEIGTADLSRVIAAYPSVLLLDAERQILPAASYLMNDLGIWEDDLPRVLQLFPTLLGMETAQMECVASYLISLDVAPENLASIFRSFPALLTLDVEKDMAPVVEFLRSIGIANVGRFISRLPPVLGYSVERELKPKWEFVKSIFVDARFEITRFPAYFSYPLERVIKTRFEYLKEVKRVPIPLVALDQVLRYGDADFAKRVANDDDGGHSFREFAEQRKEQLTAKGQKTHRRKTVNK